jgi:hypothetical protein
MPISNFPGGFSNGVNVRGLPILNTYSGTVFWVDSVSGSNGNKGSFDRPFATIDYAIGKCTAGKGDNIMVKALHTETISAAAGIALDVSGVSVIGLGVGNSRPVITLDTGATTTVAVTAANVTLRNLIFSANYADITACITTTKKGTNIIGCDFVDTATNMNFLTPIKATSTTNNDSDGLRVEDCLWSTPDAAALEFLEVNANLEKLVLRNNRVYAVAGTATPLILCAGTKVLSGASIEWNFIQNGNTANDVFIDNGGSTGQSGIVAFNLVGNLDTTGAQTFGAATGLQFFENYSTSTSTEAGALAQAADTPLS